MNYKQSSIVPLLGTIIALVVVTSLIMSLLVMGAQTAKATEAAPQPVFNQGRRNGGAFIIRKPDGTTVENVSGYDGVFEENFVRVGSDWNLLGSYPKGGDTLEVCENKTVYLWVYAHNTVGSKYNHSDVKTTGELDFQGTAVAKNTTVTLRIAQLDENVYQNQHTVTGTLDAKNAQASSDQALIYCDEKKIAITTAGTEEASIRTWANVATHDNQVKKNKKAVEAFGAEYGLQNADEIFASGASIGYDGNLPACRYYGGYIKVAVNVKLKPEGDGGSGGGTTEVETSTPVALPDTAGDLRLTATWIVLAAALGTTTFLTTYLHFAYVRSRR